MNGLVRRLSLILLFASWACLIALLMVDGAQLLHLGPAHQHLSALALVFVGVSYIAFQFAATRRRAERVKGVLLGTAFVLWGSEQFLPVSALLTILDTLVIGIFVVDISLVILDRVRTPDK